MTPAQSQPHISILIPFHNVEAYLRACLNSVVGQRHTRWECILVDDCSTDSSPRIAREFAAADPRFRLITNPRNLGVAASRNRALDAATGTHICFIDADDVVHPLYLSTLLGALLSTGSDIATSRHTVSLPFPTASDRPARITTLPVIKAMEKILYQNSWLQASMWGHIFSRRLFDTVRFTPGIIYEDLDVFDRLWSRAERVAVCHATLYHYRVRTDSTMHRYSEARLDSLTVTARMQRRIAATIPALTRAATDRRLSANFNAYRLLSRHGLATTPLARHCWQYIRRHRLATLLNPHTRLKNKAGALLSLLLGPRLFSHL